MVLLYRRAPTGRPNSAPLLPGLKLDDTYRCQRIMEGAPAGFLLTLGRGSKQRIRRRYRDDDGGQVVGAACGATCTLLVTGDGEVAGWGKPMYHELSAFDTDAESAPESEQPDEENEAWRWVLRAPRRVSLLAMGPHHALAALEGGGLVSWGLNRGGWALGLGQCGCCRSCGVTTGQHQGAASTGADIDVVATPREVPALQGVRIVCLATGEGHSLCVTCEGAVLSWGLGSSGQLGLGPSPRRKRGRASPTAGGGQEEEEEEAASSTCRPTAICWDLSSQPAKAVSVGKSHSLVLTRSGRVLSFGSSLYQQLGHGGNTAVWTPRVVSSLEGVGEMLPDGSFSGMQSVACGAWHSVALSTTGDLYGWGWNRFGQLGTDTTLVPLPRLLPPVFLAAAAGGARGGQQGEEEVSFEQVGAGHRYTAALSVKHGLLFFWGCLGLTSAAGNGCEASAPTASAIAGTAVVLGGSGPAAAARVVCGHEADVEAKLSPEERQAVQRLSSSSEGIVTGMACGPWHLLLHGRAREEKEADDDSKQAD